MMRSLTWLTAFGAALVAQAPVNQQPRLRASAGAEGHVMVVIQGGEFTMGSPPGERGRSVEETPHRVRIPRTYAIATTEVTNDQFARFLAAVPEYAARWKAAVLPRFGDPPRFAAFSRTPTARKSASAGTTRPGIATG